MEIPGFDAIRVNQSAILERFDRMEGLVHRLASPDELFERVDGLKRQMQTAASQREVAQDRGADPAASPNGSTRCRKI